MENIIIKGNINPMPSKNKAILSSQIKLKDILKIYKIDREVNRDLSYNRIPSLVKYLKENNSSLGIYFPAFVFSFRDNPIFYYDKNNCELTLNTNNELIVLDGQHRLYSLTKYTQSIKDINERDVFLNNSITCQIYFGLDAKEERKLFSDINSNAKKASLSLVSKYDSRDIMNILINELCDSCVELEIAGIEINKSRMYRPQNKKFCTGVRLKEFVSYLLFNKTYIGNSEEIFIKNNYEEIITFLRKFFSIFFSSLPEVPGDVEKYVLGHQPFQCAIAMFCNYMIIKKDTYDFQLTDDWEEMVEQLRYIDWGINNSNWNKWLIKSNTKIPFLTCINRVEDEIYNSIKDEIFYIKL